MVKRVLEAPSRHQTDGSEMLRMAEVSTVRLRRNFYMVRHSETSHCYASHDESQAQSYEAPAADKSMIVYNLRSLKNL